MVQKKTKITYIPELNHYGNPIWWHHHGNKMRVIPVSGTNRVLTLKGSAASLTVAPAREPGWWTIDWEVVQSRPDATGAHGRAWFSDDDLRSAFGFSNESGQFGDWLITRFGGTCANQGKYIRWKDFLNIPCPGTGHDGDPNISIQTTPEIRSALDAIVGGSEDKEHRRDWVQKHGSQD